MIPRIHSKPAGLLSLLGVKGGDAPSILNDVLSLQLEALPFYIANRLQIDASGTAIAANTINLVIYPALTAVPLDSLRYIEYASAMMAITGVGAGFIQGWQVLRSNGSIYPVSAVTYGPLRSTNGLGFDLQPYSALRDFILQPGDRLGMMVSTENTITAQLNFGIRFADFIL